MRYEPHPWNEGFVWPSHGESLERLSLAQVRQYDEQGFVVVEDAIELDLIDELTVRIDELDATTLAFLAEQPDGKFLISDAKTISFTPHLVTRSAVARRFAALPFFQDVAHDLIGPSVRLYWDQSVYKRPEKPQPFPWHQDNGYTYVEPQSYLTCWVALTDATVANGCPWVVPGLHRAGTLSHHLTPLGFECLSGDVRGAVAAPVRAGGVVLFSSLTPHLTGPNRSDAVRKTYILQYAPDGACVVRADGNGGRAGRELQNDAQRQYLILEEGRRLEVPSL